VVENSGHAVWVRAAIRHLSFDPDPRSLPDDPAAFCLLVRLLVGPEDGLGEESFDVTVCSPEWLGRRCRTEGIVSGRHHLIVDPETFDGRTVRAWLEQRVAMVEATSWDGLATQLAQLGWWEFEGLPS
jgi:hypothetical protein